VLSALVCLREEFRHNLRALRIAQERSAPVLGVRFNRVDCQRVQGSHLVLGCECTHGDAVLDVLIVEVSRWLAPVHVVDQAFDHGWIVGGQIDREQCWSTPLAEHHGVLEEDRPVDGPHSSTAADVAVSASVGDTQTVVVSGCSQA